MANLFKIAQKVDAAGYVFGSVVFHQLCGSLPDKKKSPKQGG